MRIEMQQTWPGLNLGGVWLDPPKDGRFAILSKQERQTLRRAATIAERLRAEVEHEDEAGDIAKLAMYATEVADVDRWRIGK